MIYQPIFRTINAVLYSQLKCYTKLIIVTQQCEYILVTYCYEKKSKHRLHKACRLLGTTKVKIWSYIHTQYNYFFKNQGNNVQTLKVIIRREVQRDLTRSSKRKLLSISSSYRLGNRAMHAARVTFNPFLYI